ncbi:hypothetical protein B7760_02045 [Burkholderia glumae]|uniref:hypothetical protein n=1 Tax=Burkholderia glumae TaxID=337 RepID=UPI00157B9D1B|nr:hypothetical protein [Burkholderia glumae]MCR1769038.1 hypothetical protein [Burkholderia glumae]QKM48011.1 hypothetical protein B7760_02045 [Burkholderia glumae]
MNYRIWLGVAVITTLPAVAACSYSSADLRAKEPVFSGSTRKPLPDYAGCVQEGWLGLGISAINYIPKGAGVSLSVNGIAGSDLLLDSQPTNDGSRVLIFSRLPYGYDSAVAEAKKCL